MKIIILWGDIMEFFAGANTRYGFKSIFSEALSDAEKVYILKGSSGCGKSTLMRRIAEKGKKNGFDIDHIYCSADPKSLDGIIIPKIRIAIIDGTAPHVMDVKYPCVRESIINLGQFWDESKLFPQRDRIIYLTDLKSCHYKNAYRALSAAGNIQELERELLSECIDTEKTDKIAFKLCEKLFGKKGKTKRIYTSSFSSAGYTEINSFGDIDSVYSVNGKGSWALINALCHIAFEAGEEVIISTNVMDPDHADAIYFPHSKALVLQNKASIFKNTKEIHSVSATRYISNTKAASMKNRLMALEKLGSELLYEAKKELLDAKNVHDEIESIYIPAMDFAAMDEYTNSLSKNIFGE